MTDQLIYIELPIRTGGTITLRLDAIDAIEDLDVVTPTHPEGCRVILRNGQHIFATRSRPDMVDQMLMAVNGTDVEAALR